MKLQSPSKSNVLVTNRSFAAVLLLAAGVLAGCPEDKPDPQPPVMRTFCETREQCEPGWICTDGKFCAQCSTSGQCLLREQCDPEALTCGLREGWGEDCTLNSECAAGSWCHQGLCKARAEVSLCPGGSSDECPDGLRCNATNFVCEEDLGCAVNEDCSAQEVCNTGSHQCVPRCTVETAADVCSGGEKCVAERCVQCETAAECGPGLLCDAAGRCAAEDRCYTNRDCPVPTVCFVETGACLPKPPPCASDEECSADRRCDLASGACVPRACQPDVYEPNQTREAAFDATPGTYENLTLCEGDIDYWGLVLARGDQLGVNVEADPFAEDSFRISIQDGTGRTVAAGRLLASYVAPASEKYFVAISTTDSYRPYDVTFLRSQGTPCDDDAMEPNDNLADATVIASSGPVDGVICPQDQDHFSTEVPEGKGLKVVIGNTQAGSGVLRFCILKNDVALRCTDTSVDSTLSASPAELGGTSAKVRVNGATDRTTNAYSLQLEFP